MSPEIGAGLNKVILPGVSLGYRATAFIADLVIVITIAVVFILPLQKAGIPRGVQGIWSFTVLWAYFALLESSKYQATLGKRILGLRVVNLSGERISLAQATGRHFSRKIAYCCFLGLGTLAVMWTPRKQALHDWSSQTLVVKSVHQ